MVKAKVISDERKLQKLHSRNALPYALTVRQSLMTDHHYQFEVSYLAYYSTSYQSLSRLDLIHSACRLTINRT